MAKQANRMMIGGFVVIAVILMAASLIVFGSGKFFKKTEKCVLYFDESVKGLDVGAPVLFQGVQVGSVTSIVIQADLVKLTSQIPVIIEIEPDKFTVRDEDEKLRDFRKNLPKLIEKGLRAQLTMQSFITGKLLIELNFHPHTPVTLQKKKDIDKEIQEIPTIPSATTRLTNDLKATLAGIDKLINNPDLPESIKALKDTLQEARKLVTRLDRQVDPVAKDVRKTVKDFGKLARDIDAKVDPLATDLEKTLSGAKSVISDDAPVIVGLENTLKEISAMARSFRQLADYLEQHPESLLRGKGKTGGK